MREGNEGKREREGGKNKKTKQETKEIHVDKKREKEIKEDTLAGGKDVERERK